MAGGVNMAGLHKLRTHKQRGVDSHRFVVEEAGGTPARLVGTSQSGGRYLSREQEDAVVVRVKASFIG